MGWYAKLSAWQRIGIVLSILWVLIAGLNIYSKGIESAERSAKFSYDICIQTNQLNHKTDSSNCELERSKDLALYKEGNVENALLSALIPIPFGWLYLFILIYVVRAQVIGFRAVVPWAGKKKYQKAFIVFCIGVSGFTLIFLLMFAMDTYVDTKVPVTLSSLNNLYKSPDNNYVSVQGTWTRTDLTNDTIMNPLQTSKINCIRQDERCYQATASVSGGVLMSDIDTFGIESWSKDSVVFSEDVLCAKTLYTIDFNTHAVSAAGHVTNSSSPGCSFSISSHDHWEMLLTDGFKVYWEMRQKARPYLLRLIQSWFGN